LDREAGIYKNRKMGVFAYNIIDNTYGTPPVSFLDKTIKPPKERLILDFGDIFLLDSFIKDSGLASTIEGIEYGNPDTLKAMVCYYILSALSNCHAHDWWEGSYARLLYPDANLTSQRISAFLQDIGEEASLRRFFKLYLASLGSSGLISNILIDSTGLPNNVHFPLTAVSNHNGKVSNEVRLIYVTDQMTGLPIYFRYCNGNIVDVTTLIRTVRELRTNGVKIKLAILDAGYYSDDNFLELYDSEISFVTRMKENRKIYKELVAEHIPQIERRENIVGYNGRYLYIKVVECQLIKGHPAYAYIGLDIDRKGSETKKLFAKAKANGLTDEEVFDRMSRQGIFVLVSSQRVMEKEILPIYYTRQEIEQVFDIGKNYTKMVPVRLQSETTFRGHLLLTFIATVVLKKMQTKLNDTPFNIFSLFLNMRNQKCKVYDDHVITAEPFKKANDAYELFKVKCPITIERITQS
jgi:hypothetical protein